MKPKRLFAVMPEMECLAGDTIDVICVEVQKNGEFVDVSNLTMNLIVANADNPETAVLVKKCTLSDNKFTAVLTSEDTVGWRGEYLLHFALCDAERLVYRKLAGTLHVYPVPKGGIT